MDGIERRTNEKGLIRLAFTYLNNCNTEKGIKSTARKLVLDDTHYQSTEMEGGNNIHEILELRDNGNEHEVMLKKEYASLGFYCMGKLDALNRDELVLIDYKYTKNPLAEMLYRKRKNLEFEDTDWRNMKHVQHMMYLDMLNIDTAWTVKYIRVDDYADSIEEKLITVLPSEVEDWRKNWLEPRAIALLKAIKEYQNDMNLGVEFNF